ncbi:hypothetical protein [Paenibacillus sp. DP01]|uniref:hypothetical protein n=1 Tax=Paenibacillus sp. DP01 TaxID=3373096 RepID=UPI00384AD110
MQKRFEGCRNKLPLPFDFTVYSRVGAVAIEYDGEQHTRPVDFAGKGMAYAQRLFAETQRNDRIKTDYCLANGIPLIRINHTEFDRIEEILMHRLAELGVTGKRLSGNIAQNSSKKSFNNGKLIPREGAA